MKIRVKFCGPRQVRILFRSIVSLNKTFSYLLVRAGDQYNHYLRLCEGTIEVVRFHKNSQAVKELKFYPQSLKKAATTYHKTFLAKTDEAKEVLTNILASDDENQINFLFENDAPVDDANAPAKSKLEKPTKQERHKNKANTLSMGHLSRELGVAPTRIRAALRRAHIKKPGTGWSWAKSEHDQVVAMIKKALEG